MTVIDYLVVSRVLVFRKQAKRTISDSADRGEIAKSGKEAEVREIFCVRAEHELTGLVLWCPVGHQYRGAIYV